MTFTKLKLNYSSLSDLGLVRKENQDNFGFYESSWGFLFVVADGFGDIAGGTEASKKVVEGLIEKFSQNAPADPYNFVKDALLDINGITFSLKTEEYDNRMMGSTCAAALIDQSYAYITNVGDSRIYLVRKGSMVQLSRDQSLVQDMVDRGIIDQEDAATHPGKNILTEAIGSHTNLDVYCCENPVELMRGDKVILCSDGLWGLVEEDQILSIVENNVPEEAVSKLVKTAKENGGHDNITVQVVQVAGSS